MAMSNFIWDPGSAHPAGLSSGSWVTRKDLNKLVHSLNGNREHRGKGIICAYWNKGPAFLINKQNDIESVLKEHKPSLDWVRLISSMAMTYKM